MRAAALLLVLTGCVSVPALGPLELRERWVYFPQDLKEAKNADKLVAIMGRAARAGYTTVLLEDPNFGRLPLMNAAYFENLERIKKAARDARLDLVPSLFQVGHSENLLSQDPNLAEGLPVRDALFVVKSGTATIEADPPVALRDGWDHKDPTVDVNLSIRNPKGKLARFWQKIKVHPFRHYRVSVQLATHDFVGTPRIVVFGGGRMLNFDPRGPHTNQHTMIQSAVFNSLDCTEVRVAFGAWNGESGDAMFLNPKIEEIGLLNVLRRPGAPLVVRTEEGRLLKEGEDFDPVADPGLVVPFTEWHEPPVLRTKLPDGTRLRVSYYHPLTFPDGGQMMICPSEPKTLEILRDQARRLHAIFHAKAYFMSHDEMRVCNWDESCARRGLTAGQIFADNVRTCIRILRETSPSSEIYCWSDMFDPVHNAHDDYYLARGGMAGTWEGLDRDVIVATWFYDRRDESLEWFSSRGHRTLIAGYYDQKPERARDWLLSARRVNGTIGIMYTSWYDKYEDLETFASHLENFH
jgi:hypothetical protein